MLLSRYGAREIALCTVLLGLLGTAAWHVSVYAVAAYVLLWLACLAFFRDPRRAIPATPGALVAPADGHVTEISELEYHDLIGAPATRIGVFLSVFDVHVNRAPCGGRVVRTDYQPGEFLDARHAESGQRNESLTLVIEPDANLPGPIVVRQVAGLIARRIVCAAKPGDRLTRGQRYGMIKFGSRTELITPRGPKWRTCVTMGQTVRGGVTILVQYQAARTADENIHETHASSRYEEAAAR